MDQHIIADLGLGDQRQRNSPLHAFDFADAAIFVALQ